MGRAFILAWPQLLGLEVARRPKGQSPVAGWGRNMFLWLGSNGLFGGF